MFSDDDFDFGALLDDDFLTSSSVLTAIGLRTMPSEKGKHLHLPECPEIERKIN